MIEVYVKRVCCFKEIILFGGGEGKALDLHMVMPVLGNVGFIFGKYDARTYIPTFYPHAKLRDLENWTYNLATKYVRFFININDQYM